MREEMRGAEMGGALADDEEFEPFDALLEEALADATGLATGSSLPQPRDLHAATTARAGNGVRTDTSSGPPIRVAPALVRRRAIARQHLAKAALLLLGIGTVTGALVLQQRADAPAAESTQPAQDPTQDPQPPAAVVAPREREEIARLLPQVRRVVVVRGEWPTAAQGQTFTFKGPVTIRTWTLTDSDPFGSVSAERAAEPERTELMARTVRMRVSPPPEPEEPEHGASPHRALDMTVIADADAVARWREALQQSTATLVGASSLRMTLYLRLELADGRVLPGRAVPGPDCAVYLGDVQQPFAATPELARLLREAQAQAQHNGHTARGEAASTDELRALPATSERVHCPYALVAEAPEVLGRFAAIVQLQLDGNADSQPNRALVAAIAALRTLRELRLPAAAVDADAVRALARLPSLQDLQLIGPHSARPGAEPVAAALRELRELRSLTVDAMPPTRVLCTATGVDADGFAALVALPRPKVDGNTSAHVPAELVAVLPSLPRLQRLVLRGGGLRPADVVEHLLRTHVREATLSLAGWDAATLARLRELPSLRMLSLRDTLVGDSAVAGLGQLTQLLRLDLTNTPITPDGLAALRRALPGCEVVRAFDSASACPGQVGALGEQAAWTDCKQCHTKAK